MRPCQRQHYNRKKDSYRREIKKANIAIDAQRKRILCFQGLIKQLEVAMVESVRKQVHDDDD